MGILAPKKGNKGLPILAFLFVLIFLPIIAIYVFLYLLWGVTLCAAIWLMWGKRNILFVYSDSPIWKDYMEREILPFIQDRAVILNWSERKNWRNSLAVRAFRHFGGDRNFNPMAMVFRPFRFPKTYRFYEAFRDFKHGDARKVEHLKRELHREMG